MNREDIEKVLQEVAAGNVGVNDALDRLQAADVEDLGFARLDTDRERRTGIAEVIFAPGKTDEQLEAIVERCLDHHAKVLVTRLDADRAPALLNRFDQLRYHAVGRILEARPEREPWCPAVAVVSAGTSDIPVAEEAALTAELMVENVERAHDVGVAGLHRLLSQERRLARADVIIAVAGMEGALPSVVAGLVSVPVIAVPTSIGYGTAFGGVAALLGMLNSCASGLTVVNIDNGFGAGYMAAQICRLVERRSQQS